MSNQLEDQEISKKSYILTVVAFLGVMLLFALIIAIAYIPNRPTPANEDIVKERKARLAEVNSKQKALISRYAWVDKNEKIVRLPIERAMQLTVRDLQNSDTQVINNAIEVESFDASEIDEISDPA